MALFRRLFYRKPPDRLLEITERVYVFDCCFSSKVMEEDEYRDYMDGIVAQLQSYFPEASFMVFNFREGERKSQISDVLLPYDMTVMNYPQQYVGCPVLPFDIVQQFLKACDSWLSLGRQQNVLLMHCERGGWPVLAFMLAGLLLYKKQYMEEQRMLDMVYAQAPKELFRFFSPLDPLSSHLRYLRYISRQGSDLEEPLQDTPFTLTCLVLRVVPNFDGEGGCRPFLRVYGQDPLMPFDRTPKLLFSTFRTKEKVRHFRQADSSEIKLDVNCCVQGDVVLECIHMDEDLEKEVTMFRVMFSTSFIQSNILLLDHEEIDVLWNTKEQFVKQFKAEVHFSEFDAGSNAIAEPVFIDDDETECDSAEEFFEAEEILGNLELSDEQRDPDVQMVPIKTSLEDGSCNAVLDFPDLENEAKNIIEFSGPNQDLDIISGSQHLAVLNNASLMPEILTEKVVKLVDSSTLKDDKSFDGEKVTALKKMIMKNGCNSLVGEQTTLEPSAIKQGALDVLYKFAEDLAVSNTSEFKQLTKDMAIALDDSAQNFKMAIADEMEVKLDNRASKHDIGSDLKEKKRIQDDKNSKFKISNMDGGISYKLETDDCRWDDSILVVEVKSKLQPANIKMDGKDIPDKAGKGLQAGFFRQRIQNDVALFASDGTQCKSVNPTLADEGDNELENTASKHSTENGFPRKDCIQCGVGSDTGISDMADGRNHKLETDDCRLDPVTSVTHVTEVPAVLCQAQECNILYDMCIKLEISESRDAENGIIQNSMVPIVLYKTTEPDASPSPSIVSSSELGAFSSSASSCTSQAYPLLETKSIHKASSSQPLFSSTSYSSSPHSTSSPDLQKCVPLLDFPARPPLPSLVNVIPSHPPPPPLLHSRSSIKVLPPPSPPPPPPPPPPPWLQSPLPPVPPSSLIATIFAPPVPPAQTLQPPPVHETPPHPPFPCQLQEIATKKPSPPLPSPIHPPSSAQLSSSPNRLTHSDACCEVPKQSIRHIIWSKSDDPPHSLPLEDQDGISQGLSPPLPSSDNITGLFPLTQSPPPQRPPSPSPPLPAHFSIGDQSLRLSTEVAPPSSSLPSFGLPPPPPPPPLSFHLIGDSPPPPPLREVPSLLPPSGGHREVPSPPPPFGHMGVPPSPPLPKEHQRALSQPLPLLPSGNRGVPPSISPEGHAGAPPPPLPSPGGLGGAPPPPPPPGGCRGASLTLSPGGLGGAPHPPPPPGGCRGAPPLTPSLGVRGRAPPPPPPPGGHGGGPPPPPPPVRCDGGPPPPPLPGRGGGPPAPPRAPGAPPPLQSGLVSNPFAGGRGHGFTRSPGPGMSASLSRKASLKPLHWVKVSRAMQGSLWAELQKNADNHGHPEFDVSELETLFSIVVKKPDKSKSDDNHKSSSKSDKVHLMDLKRANNTEIMLTKIKMPLPDMMNAVLALDDSLLDADQVENLIKFCPTKEEMELLMGYTGDKEKLGKCEQFFLELMKVPRVESKLRVFSFKIQFGAQIADIKKNLQIVNSACEELRNSDKLKEIMKRILFLGNTLNQGTARGSAVGFRLDSLLKLADTRATNNKMTLMHYLCKVWKRFNQFMVCKRRAESCNPALPSILEVEKNRSARSAAATQKSATQDSNVLASKSPALLDFHLDLINLEAASKIQLKSLAEEQQAIVNGLEKVELELSASERDGPVSEVFHKTLAEFIDIAGAEGRSITTLYSAVGKNADALAIYFGEDPARCPFEQVIGTILNFVRMFRRAHEENCKEAELEKKKAQKEAEIEKSKVGSPMKKIAR